MKFLQVVTLALLLTTGGLAATIYVPDNYATIQAALDAAVTGDTIVVRPGAYFENIDFLGKNVVLRSEAGADYTTIEGRQAGSVVTFQSGEGPGAVLEGFNIANGSGTVDSHNRTRGGGIYCVNGSSPVIRNNVISANFADIGGGISIDESSLSIIDNVIKNNRADNPQNSMSGGGGGIHCRRSSALVQGNVIEGNITLGWSAFGGGFRGWYASATIIDNLFEDNRAYSGGALALDVDGAAGPSLVEGNRFFGNQADWAGAISSSFDTTVFSRNEIRANNAENGGGVAFYASKAALQSCMITANGSTEDGGAIICTESSPSIVNCTIVANQAGSRGGAIGCGYKTNPNVVNTILWANKIGRASCRERV